MNFIKDNKIEKSKKTIIFTNYFLKATESLDYLETRGRDSASISLNKLSVQIVKDSFELFLNHLEYIQQPLMLIINNKHNNERLN